MPSKKISPLNFGFRSRQGFDFVFANEDKISFVSPGAATVVRIGTRDDQFTIVSESEFSQIELFSGSYDEVGEHFKAIRSQVFSTSRTQRLARWKAIGIAVIAMAATIGAVRPSLSWFLPDPVSNPMMLTPDQLREVFLDLQRQTLLSGPNTGALPNLGKDAPQTGSEAAGDGGGNMLGVPTYQNNLYDGKQLTEAPVGSPDDRQATSPEGNQVERSDDVKAKTKLEADEVSNLKEQVSSRLKQSGLTKEEAEKALRDISMLSPSQLSRASLDSLPPNVRQLVLDQMDRNTASDKSDTQSVEKDNVEEGVPTKIIMLPEQVIDSYRGHDGIASIPENSSWQARGNPAVSIPPPGGGDIKTVEDLKAFGMKP